MALARTNLTLPEELLAEVDAIAGPRGRSRYVADAVAQRVKRDRLLRAIEASVGSLVPPGGRPLTRLEVAALVDDLRAEVSG
ncbi:MAG: CopG family transcriptional regulator [Chloroflexota bacterium]|nr:MAG: CopG family transcriptional regulator [Chloroflexota bacterium]